MSTEKETFWNRVNAINAGMLGTDRGVRPVPMSHYADEDERALWFIGASGTELVRAATSGPVPATHIIADGSGKLWARINGTLTLSEDKAKLDEIWNAVASAWFEGGEQDPDVRLLKLSLTEAEVWATTGGIGFFYEIAKAKMTGDKPDIGDHFTLGF